MVHFLQDILKKASQRRLRRRTLTVLPLCRAGEACPYSAPKFPLGDSVAYAM